MTNSCPTWDKDLHYEKQRFMESPLSLRACIGTMNHKVRKFLKIKAGTLRFMERNNIPNCVLFVSQHDIRARNLNVENARRPG